MKKIFALLLVAVLLMPQLSRAAGGACTTDAQCAAPNRYCCTGTCQAAKCETPPDGNVITTRGEAFGFGTRLDKVAGDLKGANPDLKVEERVGSIIAIFLSFLGIIFLVLMIWAGFNWMLSGGDEEKIRKSQAMIKAAVIGLIIVVAAYALSVFIIERIWGAAN